MTNEAIKTYALSLGYEFSDEDCEDLMSESYDGETVEEAVHDYLNAYGG